MATAAAEVGGATAVATVDEAELVGWSTLVAAPAKSSFARLDGSLHVYKKVMNTFTNLNLL